MNWRTVVGACVAVLFPLPMVMLLVGVLRHGLPEQQVVNGHRVAPVLDSEVRSRLQSFHRDCQRDSDCEFPLGCLLDARAGANYCTDSQCLTDVQCQDGQACRLLTTFGKGPLVRRCVPLGVRGEGEKCVRIAKQLDNACGPGLVCSEQALFCARPCSKEDTMSCPEGFFCADTVLEPLCLPTCEKTECLEGQSCIQFERGASACAKVYGVNCQQAPCPDNQECQLESRTGRTTTVWMRCRQSCREAPSSCPPGLICNGWSCHPPCDPDGPKTCADGYTCQKERPTRPWVCLPAR